MFSERDFGPLLTEQRNPESMDLDRLSSSQIIQLLCQENASVPTAVAQVQDEITQGVEFIVERMRRGGRMILVGAGTSGRMGVLEAAECPPTFDTAPDLVQAVMAGGPQCVWASKEGAEDDVADGSRQIREKHLRIEDVVIGIASSGVTPFVLGALAEAKAAKAGRILVTCNRVDASVADLIIAPLVGPEVITGSTRLKAGTATKLVLNALTVATMVRLGKVYENLMVDLQPKSAKLMARAKRIIRTLTGVDESTAAETLKRADNRTKVAIVMLRRGVDRLQAESLLAKANGMLRNALE